MKQLGQWLLGVALALLAVVFMRMQYPKRLQMRSPDSGTEARRIVERYIK